MFILFILMNLVLFKYYYYYQLNFSFHHFIIMNYFLIHLFKLLNEYFKAMNGIKNHEYLYSYLFIYLFLIMVLYFLMYITLINFKMMDLL